MVGRPVRMWRNASADNSYDAVLLTWGITPPKDEPRPAGISTGSAHAKVRAASGYWVS